MFPLHGLSTSLLLPHCILPTLLSLTKLEIHLFELCIETILISLYKVILSVMKSKPGILSSTLKIDCNYFFKIIIIIIITVILFRFVVTNCDLIIFFLFCMRGK